MPLDLDAIRKRMQALSGTPKFAKFDVGEYKIRVIPWNPADALPEGDMFPTLYFYNLGEGKDWVQIAAPKQFDKPDPIAEMLDELWKGSEDDKAIAKKLRASGSTYVAFVDKNAIGKGVQVWRLPGGFAGQKLHQKLLSYFVDADIIEETDDWTDPKKGFDLKLTVTDSGKKFNSKAVLEYDIDIARKPSKLTEDADQLKKWLESRPSTKDYYTLESYDSVKAKLEKWIAGGPTTAAPADDKGGSTRAGKPDALDELANDVKPKTRSSAAAAKAGRAKDEAPSADTSADAVGRRSLDAALDDLENDEPAT